MLRALLGLLVLQAQGPTVGDTVWVSRTIAVPAGAAVRPQPWNPTGDVEALGPARLVRRGDSVEVAYPAVVWRPGVHEVTVPGPLLLLEGGGVDSAAAFRATLSVASVLPAVANDSALPVQPAVTTVRRADRSARPVILWLVGALALLAPLHWWWRRRGAAPVGAAPAVRSRPPAAHWAAGGESRVALAVAAAELRAAIARGAPSATTALETEECIAAVRAERPAWPVDELAGTLRALDAARFRPGTPADAAAVVADVGRLTARLTGVDA